MSVPNSLRAMPRSLRVASSVFLVLSRSERVEETSWVSAPTSFSSALAEISCFSSSACLFARSSSWASLAFSRRKTT